MQIHDVGDDDDDDKVIYIEGMRGRVNVFSAFNPSKCTHTWSSGQPTLRRPGSSWGFDALLKGLTSVVNNSCRSRDSNPQPRVTSSTLYPLGHNLYNKHNIIK